MQCKACVSASPYIEMTMPGSHAPKMPANSGTSRRLAATAARQLDGPPPPSDAADVTCIVASTLTVLAPVVAGDADVPSTAGDGVSGRGVAAPASAIEVVATTLAVLVPVVAGDEDVVSAAGDGACGRAVVAPASAVGANEVVATTLDVLAPVIAGDEDVASVAGDGACGVATAEAVVPACGTGVGPAAPAVAVVIGSAGDVACAVAMVAVVVPASGMGVGVTASPVLAVLPLGAVAVVDGVDSTSTSNRVGIARNSELSVAHVDST